MNPNTLMRLARIVNEHEQRAAAKAFVDVSDLRLVIDALDPSGMYAVDNPTPDQLGLMFEWDVARVMSA